MIAAGIHHDYDDPPNIPAFTGSLSKRPRRTDSLTNVLSDAAIAFVDAMKENRSPNSNTTSKETAAKPISPGKAIDLRMKNLQQLRYLQSLYDDGIINDSELAEQKSAILSSLHDLKPTPVQ